MVESFSAVARLPNRKSRRKKPCDSSLFTCVVDIRYLVFIPEDVLGGIQGHGIDGLGLKSSPFVCIQQNLLKEFLL